MLRRAEWLMIQGNRSHPLLWQGSQGAAGAPVGNSGLQIGPWRVPPLSAGVNDAGKQGHDPRSDVGAGAVAEFTDDDPVASRAFCFVVGER